MIDAKRARAHINTLREAIRLRKVDPKLADVDRWLVLDGKRRDLQGKVDALNSEKKELAKLGRENPDAARAKGVELRDASRALEAEMAAVNEEWQHILDWFPNWPHTDMPHGAGEEDNVEEKAWIPGVGYIESDQLGTGGDSARHMP